MHLSVIEFLVQYTFKDTEGILKLKHSECLSKCLAFPNRQSGGIHDALNVKLATATACDIDN